MPKLLSTVISLVWVGLLASSVIGSKLSFDTDGVLVIDSKKVFPIGVNLGPPVGGLAPDGRDAFKVLRETGVTFIRTGPTGNHVWNDQTITTEQRIEDAAAANGLHCIAWLHELASINESQTKKQEMLRKVVEKFKDHPGLGVWKGADEPEWGKLPVPPLVNVYKTLHELDANHPIWIVQAPRGTVQTLLPYDPAYDIAGCDIYPVSYPPGVHSLLPNKEISMVGDYTRTIRQVAGEKPFWITLQIAFSGVARPNKTLRFPTFEQERFMSYEAIINGARGLNYFGGSLASTLNERDAKLGWNWAFFDRVLRPVLDEVGENSTIEEALIAPESKLAVKANLSNGGEALGLEFCVRQAGDRLYLLACKREGPTIQVRFSGLPASLAEGDVMFESPRRVRAEGGAFTDWFGPFDVHVYRFALLDRK